MGSDNGNMLRSSMNGGLITGLVLIGFSLITYFVGLNLNPSMGYVSIIILAACIFIAGKSYRDNELGGFISYGQALGFGILVGVFASILLGFFTYLEIKFIDPDIISKQMELVRQNYAKKGINDDQIDKMMEMSKKWMTPTVMFISAILSFAFWSLLISLVTSIFIKKEGSSFNDTMKGIEEQQQ